MQGRPQQQPRGQEPSRAHRDRPGSGPPPPPHRDRNQVTIKKLLSFILSFWSNSSLVSDPTPSFLTLPPPSVQDQTGRRDQPSDQRPKSSYVGRDNSPQSPRDKRPLSGPNIRTPNLPVTEGVLKTAQQTTRPFNTYPRTDSEGGRSPTGQVRPQPGLETRPTKTGGDIYPLSRLYLGLKQTSDVH